MKTLFLIFTFAAAVSAYAQIMDTPGIFDEPEITLENIMPRTKRPVDLNYPIPSDCDSFGFEFTLNNPGILKVQMEVKGDLVKKIFIVQPHFQKLWNEPTKSEKSRKTEIKIKDAEPEFQNHILLFKGSLSLLYHVMPNFGRYTNDEINKSLFRWDESIPNALNRKTRIDIQPCETGLKIYLDGTLAGIIPGGSGLKSVKITGGTGPTVAAEKAYKNKTSTPEWEVVNFEPIANPSAMKAAQLSLKPGYSEVKGVPMIVLDGAHSSDLSLVKGLRGLDFAVEHDYYMKRTAWERHPSSQQGSIPNAFYTDAYILFALDPDTKKDRSFCLRLGRFCSCGSISNFTYADVFLPPKDEDFPANIQKAGTVTLNGKELPLYLGKFPISSGEIADVVNMVKPSGTHQTFYLDYELMGRRRNQFCDYRTMTQYHLNGCYADLSHRPSDLPSAVNVFGITFRRAPLHLTPVAAEPGNVFFNDDKQETYMDVTGVRPGKYTANWTILDTFGKKVIKSGEQQLDFAKAGDKIRVTVPLDVSECGHYLLNFQLIQDGRIEIDHPASFAVLGKDTRLAQPVESPFGTWLSHYTHGVRDADFFLKIVNKAGIRRLMPGELTAWPEWPEILKKYKTYKLTLNQFGWCGTPKGTTDEEINAHLSEFYDEKIKDFPDCRYVTIFHESFGDEPVPEREGIRGEATAKDKEFTAIATKVAAWFRKNHPGIKLCYGNNTSSSALTAALMRCNFTPEYLDFIGIETPGQGCIPERLWQGGTQGTWFAQEVGITWGKNLKVTGCFEFTFRPTRMFDNENIQAAYFMRDALLGLTYGYETIGITYTNDAGDWYPQTLWGSGGLCGRPPYMYPHPLLAAYSAMTKALDQIKFSPKTMDTGNLSLYAVEFERRRGDIVYAFWTPTEKTDIRFVFPKEIKAQLMDFQGKTSEISGKEIALTASEYPAYLIVPCKANRAVHVRTHTKNPPESFQVAESFDTMENLFPIPAPRNCSDEGLCLRPGKFEIAEVKDEEKGPCVEIRLKKEEKIPDISPEYFRIQFKKPRPLAGTPDELGIWIKGDGGWGQIVFELQDADGNVYHNQGPWSDFGALSYVTFQGWRFISYPIAAKGIKPRRNQSLGGFWSGRSEMKFPVKLIGINVILRRKTLSLTTMKDAPAVIRLKDLGASHNIEYQLNMPIAKEVSK